MLLTQTAELYTEAEELRRDTNYVIMWNRRGALSAADLNEFYIDHKEKRQPPNQGLDFKGSFSESQIKLRKETLKTLVTLLKTLAKLTDPEPEALASSFEVLGARFEKLGKDLGATSNLNDGLTELGKLVGGLLVDGVKAKKYRLVNRSLKKMAPLITKIAGVLSQDLGAIYSQIETDRSNLDASLTVAFLHSRGSPSASLMLMEEIRDNNQKRALHVEKSKAHTEALKAWAKSFESLSKADASSGDQVFKDIAEFLGALDAFVTILEQEKEDDE